MDRGTISWTRPNRRRPVFEEPDDRNLAELDDSEVVGWGARGLDRELGRETLAEQRGGRADVGLVVGPAGRNRAEMASWLMVLKGE